MRCYFKVSFPVLHNLQNVRLHLPSLSVSNFTCFEHWALLAYYAASSGNFLPTFRGNISLPFSGFKNPILHALFQFDNLF